MTEQPLDKILDLIGKKEFVEAYDAIDKAQPHPDWILELPSKSNPNEKFKTLRLDKMETLMKMLFGYAGIAHISQPIINQDKNNRFAVTVTVIYEFKGFEGIIRQLYGLATVAVSDITLLELATPKASSMAVKNAIKQLGGLFGKYLNKSEDTEDLPIEEKKVTIEEQRESILEGIVSAKNIVDLKSWRSLVYSRACTADHQQLYETKLRQLTQ
jgi:hypothetical protein